MSNTQYSRRLQLRLDQREANTLIRAVMLRITAVSEDLASGLAYYGDSAPMAEVSAELHRLRSLLERLHQLDKYEKLAEEIDAAAELTSERLAGGELERRRDAIMRQVRSGPDAEPQDVHEHPEAAPPVQAIGE